MFLFQAEREAKEAEQARKELGLGTEDDDLKALIQVRIAVYMHHSNNSHHISFCWRIYFE